jgi:hypothetical protein
VRKLSDRHRVYVINRLQPYSDEQTGMWQSIRPKIGINLLTDDQETIQRKLDGFRNLSDHFDYIHHTPELIQSIAKHAQFWGYYRCELWFDTDNEKGREYRKRYKTLSEPPRQLGYCRDCDAVSEHPMDAAAPVCSGCGSPYLELTPLGGYNYQHPDGEGWEKAGEVEMSFDQSFAARYSLTVGPNLSPWLYHERDEVREVVECEYGRLPGSATENAWARDEIMHPGRILRRAERDRGVRGGFESDDECVLTQRFYYDRQMLHFVALNRPETLPNGEVIPARVRLSEVFQKGLCIKTTPGLPYFFDAYREKHAERFIHGKYNVSPGKPMPRGNDEAPNYNKYLNVLMSGAFDHTLKTLAPSMAIVEEIFGDGRPHRRGAQRPRQHSPALDVRGLPEALPISGAEARAGELRRDAPDLALRRRGAGEDRRRDQEDRHRRRVPALGRARFLAAGSPPGETRRVEGRHGGAHDGP